jgi:hypothetical protein
MEETKSRDDVRSDRAWKAFELVTKAQAAYKSSAVPMHEKPSSLSIWFDLQDLLKRWDEEDGR